MLYAAVGDTKPLSNRLVTIDPATGEATQIATITGTDANEADAFAWVNGTLYAIDVGASSFLYTIDTSTGQATLVGDTGFRSIADLAFDPDTQTLYGMEFNARVLITIDTVTGAGTLVGSTHTPSEFDGAVLTALAWLPAELGANVIAFNEVGVAVTGDDSTGHSIRGNSIYSNAGLGIDLDGDGITSNDIRDLDAGPNDLQNIPVVGFASGGQTTRVAGMLHSEPASSFTLDFYANSERDPSGHGEGERWLGSGVVTTDENGNGSYEYSFDVPTQISEWITATATNANGSTSAFSQPRLADAPANTQVVTNTNDSGLGSLRDAIITANQVAGSEPVDIWFRLATTDPNYVDTDSQLPGGDTLPDVFVITPRSPLPSITRGNITIDGASQYYLGGNSNTFGPEIVLNGSALVPELTGCSWIRTAIRSSDW